MLQPTYSVCIDWNGDGDYTDEEEDVTSYVQEAQWSFGRDSTNQLTGRSSAGAAVLTVLNLEGLLSSFNSSSPIYGNMLPMRKVRIRTTHGTTVTQWTGYLDTVEALPSINRDHKARITAVGPLGWLVGKKVNIEMQTDITTGDAIDLVLDAAGWPSGSTYRAIDAGRTTMARWWTGGEIDALQALREIEDTEGGFLRETKDGKIAFEDRAHRLSSPHTVSQATYTSDPGGTLGYTSISQSDPIKEIFNKVRVEVRIFNKSEDTVLWTASNVPENQGGDPPMVPGGGGTLTLWAKCPGPSSPSGYIAVDEWTTVEYVANTQPDGSETDISDDVSVVATPYDTKQKLVFTNISGWDAHLTVLRCHGIAVVEGDPIGVEVSDEDSIAQFGERIYEYPGRFLSSLEEAQGFCEHILAVSHDPRPVVTVSILANTGSAYLTEALTRDVSDRVRIVADVTSTSLGIDEDFFIEHVAHSFSRDGAHRIDLECSAVLTHQWPPSAVPYTAKTIPTPTSGSPAVPDDLWGQCLVSGLKMTFGISAWKYNASVDGGEFRAKFYPTGTQLASVDLRTPEEGGIFEDNGTTDLIVTGLGATWEGFQQIVNSEDPGVWYYCGRLHNPAGWSVWSDGNPTPGYVKDRAATEDSSFADTGPPADWGVSVKEAGTGRVVVSCSRPQTNGHTIIALLIQIKNAATGSWVSIDDSSPALVIYDGSGTDHIYTKSTCSLAKSVGNGWGSAAEGHLILFDVRDSSEPGWAWDPKHCQWGTIPKGGIQTGPLHANIIHNIPGFRPAFEPNAYGQHEHIRIKIVRPPWDWNTEGYLGGEPNRGQWWRVWWIPPDQGDKTTQTFISDPIDLPVGLSVENVQARAWFENLYSRSDDDIYSGAGSGGGGMAGQGCVPIAVIDGEIATNISLGSVFSVNSNSAYTLLNPGGGTPYCGQVILWVLSGSGQPSLDTKFRVMSGESVVKSSQRDLLGAIYNAASDQWDTFFKRGG